MRAKQVFVALAAVFVVALVLSAALGSSGTTKGDPDTAQQIANITFPIAFLALVGAVVAGIFWGVSARKQR